MERISKNSLLLIHGPLFGNFEKRLLGYVSINNLASCGAVADNVLMKSSNWKKGGRNWGCSLVACFIIAFLFLMIMGPVLEESNDEDTFYICLVILIIPVIISYRKFFADEEQELSYGNVKLKLKGSIAYEIKSDKPYSGNAVKFRSNGQKEEEANYKDGKLDGLETQWHPNGRKMQELDHKDGKLDGLVVTWYESGQKNEEVNYKDDKQEGLYEEWHENGQKMTEIFYKDDEEVEGSEKYWNSKGAPVDSFEEAEAE